MGKVMSVVAGKMQRFNVENRAQKVISQAKPTPAPRFESNLKDLERVLKGEKTRESIVKLSLTVSIRRSP